MKHTLSAVAILLLPLLATPGCGDAYSESEATEDSELSSDESTADGVSSTTQSPSTLTSTTTASTAPASRDCGVDFAGEWTGTWQSSQAANVGGAASASIETDGTNVTGSLSLTVPEGTTLLLDSGPVSGTVDCADLNLSVADDLLTLEGVVDSETLTFQGTYEALLDDETSADFGHFTMTRTGDQME